MFEYSLQVGMEFGSSCHEVQVCEFERKDLVTCGVFLYALILE